MVGSPSLPGPLLLSHARLWERPQSSDRGYSDIQSGDSFIYYSMKAFQLSKYTHRHIVITHQVVAETRGNMTEEEPPCLRLSFLLVLDELGPCGLGCAVLVEKADVYPMCSMTFPSLVMATRHSPPSPNGQRSSQDGRDGSGEVIPGGGLLGCSWPDTSADWKPFSLDCSCQFPE